MLMDLQAYYFISPPISQFLSRAEMQALSVNSMEKKYARDGIIFEEGSLPKGVYLIQKGRVKVFQRSFSGADQIMNIHVNGEMIGYRSLLSNERYPISGVALEPCTVVFIPKRDFLSMLSSSFSLSNTLLKFLSHEFTVWVNTVSLLARTTVKERLLLNILILSVKYRDKSKWPIKITLSKADLACLIGTSNETLARMLRMLSDEKVISKRGRAIEISGPDQLQRIQKTVSVFAGR
jgi:CRP-like cAMP-binding protein